MQKPKKLRDYTGKFPDEETIRKTYKLEPQRTPEEKREDLEIIRRYSLNIAMSEIPLETWDAWISHLAEYDFWPSCSTIFVGTYFCLFCQVTNMDCLLCSGKKFIGCGQHDVEDTGVWSAPGKTFYSRMVEVGIEKIQAHADWLNSGRPFNVNT